MLAALVKCSQGIGACFRWLTTSTEDLIDWRSNQQHKLWTRHHTKEGIPKAPSEFVSACTHRACIHPQSPERDLRGALFEIFTLVAI